MSSPADSATFVHQFELGPWNNFIYLIGDRETRTCAVVDPAWHAATILREAERLDLRITQILCTHSHFDHVDQVDELLKTLDVPVWMLRQEVEFSGFRCENLRQSAPGESLTLGKHSAVTMVHTPGHTPGSVCYRLADSLVTGDTLFVDGCGRCDFVGGDPTVMYRTLKMLVERIPGQTRLYPGHNYGGTPTDALDAQLVTNPYLRHDTLEGFVNHRMTGKEPNTALPSPPPWSPGAG